MPVLKKLREDGYKVGMITNWNTKLRGILESHGLDSLFDFMVISTEFGKKKPSLEIYEKALQEGQSMSICCGSWVPPEKRETLLM